VPHQEAPNPANFHAKQEILASKCFFCKICPPNLTETQSHARLLDIPT
jgi:hypothetical protein